MKVQLTAESVEWETFVVCVVIVTTLAAVCWFFDEVLICRWRRNRSEGPARSIEKRKELALSRSALREFTLSLSPVLAQPSLSYLANLCYCIPCSALLAVISRREVLLHERQPHILPICVPSVNHQPVMNQETLINH